jgi:hypothetical protein
VGPIAIRRELHRQRHRLTALAAVLVCAMAISAHHSGMAVSHGHDETGTGTAAVAEMCLAAFTAVGAAIVAVALGAWALGRWHPRPPMPPASPAFAIEAPLARARGGPELLLLLCVSRR